jgi:hypothetical protein
MPPGVPTASPTGTPKASQTQFFWQRADLDKVDWALVNERYWQNTEQDRDIQRRKQAELLVFQHVPPQCIEPHRHLRGRRTGKGAGAPRKLEFIHRCYQ